MLHMEIEGESQIMYAGMIDTPQSCRRKLPVHKSMLDNMAKNN